MRWPAFIRYKPIVRPLKKVGLSFLLLIILLGFMQTFVFLDSNSLAVNVRDALLTEVETGLSDVLTKLNSTVITPSLPLPIPPNSFPADGSLNLRHVQLFLKRLRKKFTGVKIRFFCCGEYGPKLGRPHYHLILFGLDFDDKILFKKAKSGNLYTSKILSDCWGKGYVTTGAVTLQSAGYVARYCLKKINGQMADAHYLKIDSRYWRVL